MKPFQEQSYYELLEVPPHASEEEIRAAYQRACELYAEDSMAIYSLADPGQAAELRRRVLEAYEYLSEPELRAEYDRSLGLVSVPPEIFPALEVPRKVAPEPLQLSLGEEMARIEPEPQALPPPLPVSKVYTPAEAAATEAGPPVVRNQLRKSAPEISPETEISGELLRHVREAKGMTLSLLAERTKISTRHLENVEADRYDALPATVYLRGILINVARELALDPLRISKGYLRLVGKGT